jgi:hypothetical protein
MHAAQDVGSVLAGLTTRQRGGAVCIDPETAGRRLHDFNTTAAIALPQ